MSEKLSVSDRSLKDEIARLDAKLTEDLKRASYIGLTPNEAKACVSCYAELLKLVQEALTQLPEAKITLPTAVETQTVHQFSDHEAVSWWGLLGAHARY
jgi:hypothetical protein